MSGAIILLGAFRCWVTTIRAISSCIGLSGEICTLSLRICVAGTEQRDIHLLNVSQYATTENLLLLATSTSPKPSHVPLRSPISLLSPPRATPPILIFTSLPTPAPQNPPDPPTTPPAFPAPQSVRRLLRNGPGTTTSHCSRHQWPASPGSVKFAPSFPSAQRRSAARAPAHTGTGCIRSGAASIPPPRDSQTRPPTSSRPSPPPLSTGALAVLG